MKNFNHYVCTHTFTSEQSRRSFLTAPENRNPSTHRLTEKEWTISSKGEFATCLQTWVGNDDFFSVIGLQKMKNKFTNKSKPGD